MPPTPRYGIFHDFPGRLRPLRSGGRRFSENVAHRLGRGVPSPEITFDAFCGVSLDRHGATVAKRTRETIEERLRPAREVSGIGRSVSWRGRPTTWPRGGRASPTRRAIASRSRFAKPSGRPSVGVTSPGTCARRRQESATASRGATPQSAPTSATGVNAPAGSCGATSRSPRSGAIGGSPSAGLGSRTSHRPYAIPGPPVMDAETAEQDRDLMAKGPHGDVAAHE
jgi:hypothetical protein